MPWPVMPFGFIGGTVQTNYPATLDIFMVAGGGNGGAKGGGGGGGVLRWFTINPNIPVTNPPSITTFNITVGGAGAASNFNGQYSIAGGDTGTNNGGLSGGRDRPGGTAGSSTRTNAISGGGGGGYSSNGTGGTSANVTSWQGSCPNFYNSITAGNGGSGWTLDATLQSLLGVTTVGSGGAGGTAGTIQVTSGNCTVFFPNGVSQAFPQKWNTTVYAGSAGTGAGGSGQAATMYGGGGGGGGGGGRGGFVVVRYPGQVTVGIGSGTGGSKSYQSSDNKTYHVFTSSGTLTF
jgi:hypothetical protein